jgi:hypothetical protein
MSGEAEKLANEIKRREELIEEQKEELSINQDEIEALRG